MNLARIYVNKSEYLIIKNIIKPEYSKYEKSACGYVPAGYTLAIFPSISNLERAEFCIHEILNMAEKLPVSAGYWISGTSLVCFLFPEASNPINNFSYFFPVPAPILLIISVVVFPVHCSNPVNNFCCFFLFPAPILLIIFFPVGLQSC